MSHPDYPQDSTVDFHFTTRAFATGVPTTLAGTPSLEVYQDNNATPITAGVTLTVDLNSRAGLNNVRIVATVANGYTAGSNYDVVIAAGTVGGVSVVGEVVASFSIKRNLANTLSFSSGAVDANVARWLDLVPLALTQQRVQTEALNLQIVGPGAISSLSFQASAITNGAIAPDAIGASEFAQAAADKVWGTGTRQLTAAQAFDNTGQTTNLPADIQQWLSAAPGDNPAAALIAIHLDHLLAVATASFPGAADSILGEMLERVTTWRYVAQALSQGPIDWTPTEREHLRYRTQIDGPQTAPAANAPLQLQVDAQAWGGDAAAVKLSPVNNLPEVDVMSIDTVERDILERTINADAHIFQVAAAPAPTASTYTIEAVAGGPTPSTIVNAYAQAFATFRSGTNVGFGGRQITSSSATAELTHGGTGTDLDRPLAAIPGAGDLIMITGQAQT